jgi:hypothetical protein
LGPPGAHRADEQLSHSSNLVQTTHDRIAPVARIGSFFVRSKIVASDHSALTAVFK